MGFYDGGGVLSGGFCPGVLSGGFCPGGFCPGGFCPGGFCPGGGVLSGGVLSGGVRGGGLSRGVLSTGGFCPSGGFVHRGVLSIGGFCPSGGFVQRGIVRGVLSGGFCPGGFCPRILRTATKEDLQTSPAEMVFGDSPQLPGEFTSSGKTPFFPSFTQTSTTSPQHHRVDTLATPLATLARSKYVVVRVGPQHPSLQRPYQGPFKVIQTGNKTFKVLMNKGPQTISVDRLKPATHRHKHEQVGLLTSLIAGIIEHLNVH